MNAPTVTSRVKIAEVIEIYGISRAYRYLSRGIDDSRFWQRGNKSRYDFFILRRAIYDVTAPVIQRVSNLQAVAIRDFDNDGRR